MKSIKLEIKITDNGTTAWQVFLEQVDEGHLVKNWDLDGIEYSKKIDTYKTDQDPLKVMINCVGGGASLDYEIVINGKVCKKSSFNCDDGIITLLCPF